MDEFMRRIPDNIYIFEVTKLCGYGEFVMVYKNASIYDLFNTISNKFGHVNDEQLFFMNEETRERHLIQKSVFFTVKDLILKFQNTPSLKNVIKPLYEMPAQVVYRIYYDDGHTLPSCGCRDE